MESQTTSRENTLEIDEIIELDDLKFFSVGSKAEKVKRNKTLSNFFILNFCQK